MIWKKKDLIKLKTIGISHSEAEEYFETRDKWNIEDFLNSTRETIKFIAAPIGTGKTSFAKYTVMTIVKGNLLGQNGPVNLRKNIQLKDVLFLL